MGRGGDIPCLGKSKSTNSGTTNSMPFLENEQQIMQIMQGWQKLLVRNSGRLLLFPGGLWMVAVLSWRTFLVHQPARFSAPH